MLYLHSKRLFFSFLSDWLTAELERLPASGLSYTYGAGLELSQALYGKPASLTFGHTEGQPEQDRVCRYPRTSLHPTNSYSKKKKKHKQHGYPFQNISTPVNF